MEYWATIENKNSSHTSSNKILATFKRPFLRRGRTDSWNNIAFVIPVVSSSRLDGCRIMNNRYFVKVCVFELNLMQHAYTVHTRTPNI